MDSPSSLQKDFLIPIAKPKPAPKQSGQTILLVLIVLVIAILGSFVAFKAYQRSKGTPTAYPQMQNTSTSPSPQVTIESATSSATK